MRFPLGLWDLSLWLAVTAIVLLVTSEMLPVYYEKSGIYVNKKKLRNAALAVSVLFLVTVALRIVQILGV